MDRFIQMNLKKDDKVNGEIKRLLKKEIKSVDESLIFKKADKIISSLISKKQSKN